MTTTRTAAELYVSPRGNAAWDQARIDDAIALNIDKYQLPLWGGSRVIPREIDAARCSARARGRVLVGYFWRHGGRFHGRTYGGWAHVYIKPEGVA